MNEQEFIRFIKNDDPKTKAENDALIEDFNIKLGIIESGKEGAFWRVIVEVLDNSIKVNNRNIEKFVKDKITELPADEFRAKLIEKQECVNALEMLKKLPEVLISRYKNGIESLRVGFKDPNFITRLIRRKTEV